MRKNALLLFIVILGNIIYTAVSIADGLPVSFGMSQEEVKAVLGKPSDVSHGDSNDILIFYPISFSKFQRASLFCVFYDNTLLDATYYVFQSRNMSKDIEYLRNALKLKYGSECKDNVEVNKCYLNMEALGINNIRSKTTFIWKPNNIFIVLSGDDTNQTISLKYMVDIISIAYNTDGL